MTEEANSTFLNLGINPTKGVSKFKQTNKQTIYPYFINLKFTF